MSASLRSPDFALNLLTESPKHHLVMFGALATLQASSLSLLGTPRNFERLDCPRTFHCLKGWIARGQLLRPKSGGAPDTPTPQRKSRARRARDVGALRASGLAAEVALWSLPIFSPSVAFAPSARSSVEPSPCWGEDVPTFAFAKAPSVITQKRPLMIT